ncbi:MAG: hypothetical protein ACNA7J_13055 [Wenzhouxiangella sp.]
MMIPTRWILAGVMLVLLTACVSPAPDEEQIRQRLDDMATALAERNARAVMAPLADDFSAETWDLDQRGIRLVLQRELRAHQRLRARIFDLSVEMHDHDRASAQFHVVLTGGSGLLPEQGRWYRARTGWRRDGPDWMLIALSWEDAIAR